MKEASANQSTRLFGLFVLFVAGMGGLLYGIDIGIIDPALLYLGKTVNLTIGQTSLIVAAVLGGTMLSSLVAGVLSDWLGRKPMMLLSGFLFVVSVAVIVLSDGFIALFLGRLLQGLSGGVIAVVVPLYLAESLSASDRGKGAGIFQLMLTVGIVIASLSGVFYTNHAETAIAAAAGNYVLIRAAQNHAWRGMFLSLIYPGLIFFVGTFFLTETPRWLFRRGLTDDAYRALRRTSSDNEAALQLREMQDLAPMQKKSARPFTLKPLLQRKYVVPFLIACVILTCNQTTGINSILSYLTIILRQAGMSARVATQGALVVKVLNCVMTVVAVALIDRRGRKFLLVVGTAGVILALSCTAFVFRSFESKRVDIKSEIQPQVHDAALTIETCKAASTEASSGQPMALSVLYSFGKGEKLETALCGDPAPILHIVPESTANTQTLVIKHAFLGPVPTGKTGWLVAAFLALFIASFAVGPGVVVWLALSELMPTRIRSAGMGIALTLNQGTSTLIAGTFLPIVGNHGYGAIFAFWAACTVVYFATAAFFLPETKGKTLEEIEALFDQPSGKELSA